ncbi:hypothetical protein [Persicobacter diffluens]|uniref:Uncharacterized protein n=1 Tax=Persicobacter diffluens TaxID=981 RepID=A0AAN4W375_9BACT|nr:hypothetical protein PEDI_54410 [Persicobacter diffluens]
MISLSELANRYNVHVNTLKKYLTAAGIRLEQKLITPKKLQEIYEALGKPD